MCNEGNPGHIYVSQYQDMEPVDISKLFGDIILDGYSQKNQFKKKLKPQYIDNVNGYDFIARCMGPNPKWK